MGYTYLFLELEDSKYADLHPATKKIHLVNDFLKNANYDVLVFLDSDAWIQDVHKLNDVIDFLTKDARHGCFSRDPILIKNTFINSGSFIIKIDDFAKQMYEKIINNLNNDSSHHKTWPFDQFYISNFVYEHKDEFIIFKCDTLNTPEGQILRHNWHKNSKMYEDLKSILASRNTNITHKKISVENYYDTNSFPNVDDVDLKYN
jgi:hypothetical protein